MTVASYFMAWNAAAVICLAVGLALMLFEMFTPGMGAPGLLGAIALIASIVLSARSFGHALITLALILVVLGVFAFFVFRAFGSGKLSRIVLQDASTGDASHSAEKQKLVGMEGKCVTMLRPAGIAEFEGKRLDVVTEGEFLPKDSPVRVDRVEGPRIIVKAMEEAQE